VWLIYITVDDLDHSIDECQRLGGSLVAAPRSYGGGRYCVIKDPAGARLRARTSRPDAGIVPAAPSASAVTRPALTSNSR
jgi:hypothetical protein